MRLLETLIEIDEFNEGYWDFDDVVAFGIPDPSLIDFDTFNDLYTSALMSVSDGQLADAKQSADELFEYLRGISNSEQRYFVEYDPWLANHNITSPLDFLQRIRECDLKTASIVDFCRNTTHKSSLPYLESILSTTNDSQLRLEANLAIGCLTHSYPVMRKIIDYLG